MQLYQYDLIYDFTSGVDTERLHNEIVQSAIASTLVYVVAMGTGYIDIYFQTALSGGDETILDGIVASHDGTIMHPKAELYDENGDVIYVTDLGDHLVDETNPHEVDKADLGLTNVTDDPQLKRSANDFITFPEKTILHNDDKFIIECQTTGQKKWARYANIHGADGDGSGGWAVGETIPVDPYLTDGDGWFKPSEETLYIYDATRDKWLSAEKDTYWFAYRSSEAEDLYLRAWGYMKAHGNNRGMPIPYDMTIIGIYAKVRDKEGTVDFHVRTNNNVTNILTLSISSGLNNKNFAADVDLNQDDYLHCYLGGDEECGYPYVLLKLARRGS